ncbi:gliding motility-associated ABC transporter substrate-binding protein GldG [Fulvitalea axinellae]|uniref:Gliding motility-associated ABC transporter substrate-binding protein GldG n=1 Tax=Fulvitalea axinellae TaxID=1182444 RepID=A0AAU9CTT7_9BACT|nr:gliding motility-associated ABC transporter substrate-binding protein GldG [Fulvitalea axinellae]
MVNFHTKRIEDLLKAGIGLLVLLALNLSLSGHFFRVDLTEEGRYTISKPTVKMLGKLEEPVFVEVFLDGDLPAGFKRLQNSVKETLDEFEAYSGHKVQYRFTDPTKGRTPRSVNETQRKLTSLGVPSTRIHENKEGKKTTRVAFPGAVINYKGQETGISLLKGSTSGSSQESLNQSIENVEYEIASAIQDLASGDKKRIAYLTGNGQPTGPETEGIRNLLQKNYSLSFVDPALEPLAGYDAIVMVKPDQAFSEKSLFNIDQYIMRGGNALFMLDKVSVNFDSVRQSKALVFPTELGIERLLFRYGVRLNDDLAQDLTSLKTPVVVSEVSGKPQISLINWPFLPLVNRMPKHVVTRNLDGIATKFAGTLDTVKTKGIWKTALLSTSANARKLKAPIDVSMEALSRDYDPKKFTDGPLNLAYLLEGKFRSAFAGRFAPVGADDRNRLDKSEGAKLIVVADGDIALNALEPRDKTPLDLGFDPYMKQTFANADFIRNATAFLADGNGLITARNKRVKIRPLDTVKVREQRTLWQTLNIGGPLLLLALFGTGAYLIRKKRFTGHSDSLEQ